MDKVVDKDRNLKDFLEKCFPEKIQLFWINKRFLDCGGIKMSYYMDSLLKSIRGVFIHKMKNIGMIFPSKIMNYIGIWYLN